jgi:hypothetical protein
MPINAIVNKIPTAKTREMLNVRLKDIFPCELMKPTTSGILERWQGESSMERTPHPKEERSTSHTGPDIAS